MRTCPLLRAVFFFAIFFSSKLRIRAAGMNKYSYGVQQDRIGERPARFV